jgi:hypothetical protein
MARLVLCKTLPVALLVLAVVAGLRAEYDRADERCDGDGRLAVADRTCLLQVSVYASRGLAP